MAPPELLVQLTNTGDFQLLRSKKRSALVNSVTIVALATVGLLLSACSAFAVCTDPREHPSAQDCATRVQGIHSQSNIAIDGAQLVINGQARLGPRKIASLTDNELREILTVTAELNRVNGNPAALTPPRLKDLYDQWTAPRCPHRLRMRAQLDIARQFLQDIQPHTNGQLPAVATDQQLNQLYPLAVSLSPIVASPQRATELRRHFARYAATFMARANQNGFDKFSGHFEFVRAEVARRFEALHDRFAARRAQASGQVTRQEFNLPLVGDLREVLSERIYQQVITPGFAEEVSRLEQAAIAQVSGNYLQRAQLQLPAAAQPGPGAPQDVLDLPDAELVALVRATGGPSFRSPEHTAYHVRKHFDELSLEERRLGGGDELKAYMNSAHGTINDPRSAWEVTWLADGNAKAITFFSAHRAPGTTQDPRAIVKVRADGAVMLVTYLPHARPPRPAPAKIVVPAPPAKPPVKAPARPQPKGVGRPQPAKPKGPVPVRRPALPFKPTPAQRVGQANHRPAPAKPQAKPAAKPKQPARLDIGLQIRRTLQQRNGRWAVRVHIQNPGRTSLHFTSVWKNKRGKWMQGRMRNVFVGRQTGKGPINLQLPKLAPGRYVITVRGRSSNGRLVTKTVPLVVKAPARGRR